MDRNRKRSESHEKPFLDHLEDLRWTILKMLAALLVGIIITAFFVPKVFDILKAPLSMIEKDTGAKVELVARKPVEGFSNILKIALFSGLVVSLPAMLYFLMRFVLPALTATEMKVIIPGLAVGTGLFAGGLVFSYFVSLPMVTRVMWQVNTKIGLQNLWTISDYITFITGFLFANGIVFELPLVLYILVKLGVLSIMTLKRGRRHAVVIMLLIGAFLSPPDPGSMFLVAMPMIILYEITIWVAVLTMRRRKEEEEA